MKQNEIKKWLSKKWWLIILAILVFPITLVLLPFIAFWWIWKNNNLKPKIRRNWLIVIGTCVILFYSTVVLGVIFGAGTPTIAKIKSPADQQIISISGFGVESNVKVKIYLNNNEIGEAQADKDGKFSYANISLNEGANTIKATAPNKDGKIKESSVSKVSYNKTKPIEAKKEESQTSEQVNLDKQKAEEEAKIKAETEAKQKAKEEAEAKAQFIFVKSKTETDENKNKMDLYTYPGEPNLDKLRALCKEKKEEFGKSYTGVFYYLVVFDTQENAVFPTNPFTANYGMDMEPMRHIKAIYEYNRRNGYSKLSSYNTNMAEGISSNEDI